MRYDTPVFFQRIRPGGYDPDSGNYGEDIVTEEKRYADVTDTGESTLKLVYGDARQGSKTIRLQTHYKKSFDRIRIGEKPYRVDFSRKLRTKHIFIVSEAVGRGQQKEGVSNG